jgi:hypothetical protein
MNKRSPIWSITSYYNPTRYRRRLENFRRFKSALGVPLLVVELGYGNAFELSEGDAEVLVQIPGTSVLWQKERLLNVALSRLPDYVEYVAWLDCDVVLSNPSWPELAIDAMQRRCLVQLFEKLIDLDPTSSHLDGPFEYTGDGIVAFVDNRGPLRDLSLPGGRKYRPSARGGAWAGRRSLLERHRFYDAMIIGGGDFAFAHAAYGRFEEVTQVLRLNEMQRTHYLDWATPFFSEVRGDFGYLKVDLFHYWHGSFPDRRYGERHETLKRLNFDPYADIQVDKNGAFRWSSEKPALHQFLKWYFASRDEDSEEALTGARSPRALNSTAS